MHGKLLHHEKLYFWQSMYVCICSVIESNEFYSVYAMFLNIRSNSRKSAIGSPNFSCSFSHRVSLVWLHCAFIKNRSTCHMPSWCLKKRKKLSICPLQCLSIVTSFKWQQMLHCSSHRISVFEGSKVKCQLTHLLTYNEVFWVLFMIYWRLV